MTKKEAPRFVTKYDHHLRVRLEIDPRENRTKGSFKDETDVNKIVEKYRRTGQLPSLVSRNPAYGDFSDVPSYQEALARVRIAEEAFQALPAAVRAECQNDPSVFLAAVRDPAWAEKHKLALPKEALPPSPASPNPTDGGAESSDK
ncbi:internal scaffolding protein [Apis mellifera associated microvirus 18]|nr:internal scaffolding protein [Apis mellifera associated microvirus 18]